MVKHLNSKSWVYLLILLGMVTESFASTWTCQYAELTRNLVIFYTNAPAQLPCKVYYTKPMENVLPRALWKAQNEENYCERKAEEFIEKLRSWGWSCTREHLQEE